VLCRIKGIWDSAVTVLTMVIWDSAVTVLTMVIWDSAVTALTMVIWDSAVTVLTIVIWDSAVTALTMVIAVQAGRPSNRDSIYCRGRRLNRLWGQPSFLFSGHFLTRSKASGDVRLVTHLYPAWRLRMRGAICCSCFICRVK
jgi:hypothetical protein